MIHVNDRSRHVWRDVQAEDVVGAYEWVAETAKRRGLYKPFPQLRKLDVVICWCTPPSMWHALLSQLRCR